MKSEFTITGFSDEISADFSEQLRVIKSLNIAYIEIRGANGKNITAHTLEEVKTLKKELDEAGVKISAIGSPIGKIPIEEGFEAHFELFKHTVEIAKLLESNYIRLFSFFMEEQTTSTNRAEVLRRLKQMTDYVTGSEIILLHENEKDIFGDIPERCLDLVKTINSVHFKLIFDPANFIQCHVETFPHAFMLLKEEVCYYHIKDAITASGQVVPAGYGDAQMASIIQVLQGEGYRGFLSLEPHLGHFEGFQDLEGKSDLPEFEEKSDASKFILAYDCLMKIIVEVQHE